jgi:hypothetical protein
MTLAGYASNRKSLIFQDLSQGSPPSEGSFDFEVFKEAKDKGKPQMGATRFEAETIIFEYIYPNPNGAPILLSVRLISPDRIVFMPVPDWVVESVWQGEVSGSYRFESEANAMIEEFRASLTESDKRTPIGRQ